MDCSLPGPSIHGILQARMLEWVTMPSSRGSSQLRDWTCISYISCIDRQVDKHHLGSWIIVIVQSLSWDSLRPHGLQHARLPCPSLSPPALNLSQRQHLFQWVSSLHQWPKYRSFSFSISPFNEFSGLISIRIDWFDLLLSKGLPRVFSSTTAWEHQFFGVQLFLLPRSHIHTWLLEKA